MYTAPHLFFPIAHSLISEMLRYWFYSNQWESSVLTNNDILKKLRIAYTLTSDQIGVMLRAAGLSLSTSEVNAFLRPVNDKKNRFRHVNNDTLVAFLTELLSSGDVTPNEYPIIRDMLETKSTGNTIDDAKGPWLDQLIDIKRK